MSLYKWAEKEVKLACKKENPKWDGKTFDYGCGCYASALKAFSSLLEEGHSMFSWSMTRNILERLMRYLPLTPVTDEDFRDKVPGKWPKEKDIVSERVCSRMFSLFRYEYKDGTVKYSDVDRVVCWDIGSELGYSNGLSRRVIDEMFPIKMPYLPPAREWNVYCCGFCVHNEDGEIVMQGTHLVYAIDPDGKRVEIDRYFVDKDGRDEEIDKAELEKCKGGQ